MKKIYFLLCILFLFQENKAQHTLTASFNPAIGDVESYIALDTTTGLSLGSSGPSQIWNYTGISTGTNAPYGYTYVPMSSIPNNSLYPTGTIAADVGIGGIYYVYSNTSSKVEYLGTAQPTASNCGIYSNPQIIYSLPFMYGSSMSDTFYQTNPVTGTGTTTTNGNGTGVLMLPSGTYSNILKLTILTYQTSGPNTITSVENRYYSALSKFPLLTVGSTTSSLTGITKFGKINTVFALGISFASEINSLGVFPNPSTNGELFLRTGNQKQVVETEISNAIGQVVLRLSVNEINDSETKIDVSKLQKGIYFLKVSTTQGTNTKKIIIE